ncbi:MAG: HEAT repeat domain-containing protein [Armatimonadota bacterium]
MPRRGHSSTALLAASWAVALLAPGMAALSLTAAPRRTAAKPALRAAKPAPPPTAEKPASGTVSLSGPWRREYRLTAGETVEISVHLDRPSALPPDGRVRVEWTLERPDNPAEVVPTPEKGGPRPVDAFEIYTAPTPNWQKVLHALDGDVYLLYRAPVSGAYSLKLAPVTDEKWIGDAPRWREKGLAAESFPLPRRTPWPSKATAPLSVSVNRVDLGTEEQAQRLGSAVEVEPNDTPEQAQPLALVPNAEVRTYEITGTADDLEYFDNGKVGRSGDDWFRVELKGTESRLVTAQLSMPGQFLAARIRCYQLENGASPRVPLGALLPISEYFGTVNPERLPWQEGKQIEFPEGQDPNERAHRQDEPHRTNINRILEPGKVYYFRVEANAPAYQLQIRVLKPAPYTDPRMAVRQAMYTQIGQVDAWLTNRPRGASVERRIRDTGNLLGTGCMSCHTQSGVWGPAVPLQNGYRVENRQNYEHLLNVMYECLRPTNELQDAANNNSVPPLDLGDGPAGTRVAGFNIATVERVFPPRKLHSKQQIRAANHVLQTGDPDGINAAGPGSNVGEAIVQLFGAEILSAAWKSTGDPRYFRSLETRAREVLKDVPAYTDDLAVRLDFFGRVFPLDKYPEQAQRAAEAENAAGQPQKGGPGEVAALLEQARAQVVRDEDRLRQIQNPDGSWGFHPGSSTDGGRSWTRENSEWDPAPTALAITGLTSIGRTKDDPAIAGGVQALLRMQDPSGRWNKAAITGFVTTGYALHALGRLYPVQPRAPQRSELTAKPGETLLATVQRVQALALTGEPRFADLLRQAAAHPSPLVRYWAIVGLGTIHTDAGVPVLLGALRDRAKPVRDAAVWGLRQTLLDDRGWPTLFAAYETGDDYTREGVLQALGMRADAVMPDSSVDWKRLTRTLDRAMNEDPHPAVRAWASKAAWQWWIWNPPVRPAVNAAWLRMLERAEPNALVENNNRYSSQALFIANGHRANGSSEHQYKELAVLFEALRKRLETAGPAVKSLLARRLVAVGATFYQTGEGDGGSPGQMGYATPGSGALFGQAVLVYLREVEPTRDLRAITAGLEGAANIPHGPLQEFLINYAFKAPEELRRTATEAISDPRSAMLEAAPERIAPLIAQVKRGAADPARRPTLSDPVIKLFSSVNWLISKDPEAQRHFLDLMIPKFDRYVSPEELAGVTDAAKKAELTREMEVAWYLADQMGEVLASNPDLRLDMVFRSYFPAEPRNPLERHFWVRSVTWILEHNHAPPAATPADEQPGQPEKPVDLKADPGLVIKDRALQLYLDALGPDAHPRTRAAAVGISGRTAVRRNPEVLLALSRLLMVEKDQQLRQIAENVVKQGSDRFVPELVEALKREERPGNWLTEEGKANPLFLEDITYFRDYVIPELARAKRSDQKTCMGCHGVPGSVPSFTLKPTDDYGYLSVADLLFNYREAQARVNLADLERSKLLRKPLNIQDGKEEGHQGGRRYFPQDEGYQILRKWVENQPKVLAAVMSAGEPRRRPLARLLTPPKAPALKPRGAGSAEDGRARPTPALNG